MEIKKGIVLLSLTFNCLPLYVYAKDISLKNNTKVEATGKLESITKSPCSGSVKGGVVKPQGSVSLPQSVLNLYCGIKDCTGYVYVSNNCSGDPVAVVTIDKDKGVTTVTNKHVQGYYVTKYAGHFLTLDGGP